MDSSELLTERFEAYRSHLKAVAYRMLGSLSEADDAVQEAWLRLNRTDTSDVDNLGGWLTTVVGRVCLDMLRSRTARREDPLDVRLPDPVVSPAGELDPEQEALLSEGVGLALLVVLESLTPAERLAFVLHDMFAISFEEIGEILGRSPAAARQLASRGRRRVQGSAPAPDPDLTRQHQVVEAFLTAARGGDFDALVAVLDPDVVLRADRGGAALTEIRGRRAVAGQAGTFHRAAAATTSHPALVNGAAGLVNTADGQVASVMSFTITDGRIAAIDILSDPERLRGLDLAILDD